MPDILDISKRKARDIHLESDLGHLMENCFVQSFLSKLQETIVLRVLRVSHVLLCHCMAQSTEMVTRFRRVRHALQKIQLSKINCGLSLGHFASANAHIQSERSL